MAVDPAAYSPTLTQRSDGVWVSTHAVDASYPFRGHGTYSDREPASSRLTHRNRCIVNLVRRYPPAGPVFDIGGGSGFATVALQESGFDAVLVEPDPEAIAKAETRGVSTRILAEAQAAGFRPGSLPAVGMFDVLEHIEDDTAMFRWISEALTVDGMLYVTVPAHSWLWSGEDVLAGHHRRYTLARITGLLAATGFSREFASYFFNPLVLPTLTIRALPTRLGVTRSASGDRDVAGHRPPRSGVLDALLRREARRLAGGRPQRIGSSLIVAATKR